MQFGTHYLYNIYMRGEFHFWHMGELFWERHELLQAEAPRVLRTSGLFKEILHLFLLFSFFVLAFAEATQVRRSCRDCGVGTVTFPLDSPLLLLQPTTVKRPRPSVSDEDGGSPLKRCSLAATPLKTEDWQTLGSTSWKTRCALYFWLLPKVAPFSHELGKNFGVCSSVCYV